MVEFAVTWSVSLMLAAVSAVTAVTTSSHVAHAVASAAKTDRGIATIAVVSIKHTAKRSAKDFFAICFIVFFLS